MSEVKRYTHDWRNQEMAYDEDGEFVYFEDYEHLKTKLELTNKELGLNIKSHLNDICTLEKLKAQLERAENTLYFYASNWGDQIQINEDLPHGIFKLGQRAREYFKEKEQV